MASSIWVLDTSVVAKWFFEDEVLRPQALAVRDDLRSRPEGYAIAPLLHTELIHVTARKSGRDEAFVGKALDLVLRLGIRTVLLSRAGLLRAGHWACSGLSGYDATHVALAEELGGHWLTADEEAVARSQGIGCSLAEWS